MTENSYFNFRIKIEKTLNRCCMENNSNTPDYILARYLTDCLEAFDNAVGLRDAFFGYDSRANMEIAENEKGGE